MKRLLIIIIFFLFSLVSINALEVSGEALILMDEDSGRILYSVSPYKEKLIASITKIMTAVIAIESNQLDDLITVDSIIKEAYGSNIYLEVGEKMKLRDLVYGLMLRSGNDAALVIAKYLAKDEKGFVKKMNNKAKKLGMKRTFFLNPHGLDEDGGNKSTAYDMALLTKYANQLKEYQNIVKTKVWQVKTNKKTYVWHNKNKILRLYKWSTGGKTGFTEKARRTLVTTASKNNLNLIVVTLNDGNDWLTHQTLYEHAFNNYRRYLVLNKRKFSLSSDYYKEKLYIKNDYYYPLKHEETKGISLKAKLFKNKHYKNGDKIGEVEVYFQNKIVHTEDVFIEVLPKRFNKNISWWKRILRWFT
jgi:D-alanyl-D-alanine carboxypeptidase (penicillin-binding protein 5/6)